MANSARLDELKKKFDENPRRYFAPLANEYRKQGDLAQAIALCRTHLPNQPGHISGHIVLAQALYETRELPESRQSFELALDLDPENLIALRYLGDIAREQGAPATAQVWYQRVLDADPRNDEIAQLLKDVEAEAAQAVAELATRPTPVSSAAIIEAEAPAEPEASQVAEEEPAPSEPAPAAWQGVEANAAEAEPVAFAAFDGPIDLSEPEAAAEPHDDWFADVAMEAPQAPQAAAADAQDPASFFPDLSDAQTIPAASAAPSDEVFESFTMDWASDAAPDAEPEVVAEATIAPSEVPVVEAAIEPEAEPAQELVESAAEWAAAPEVEAPAVDAVSTTSTTPVWNQLVESPEPIVEEVPADHDAFAGAVAEADEPFPWETTPRATDPVPESFASFVASEPEVPQTHEPEPDPMVGRTPAFGSLVQEEPPAPFVTETMAELYLQQGFNEEALAIYKQLLVQNPGDVSLQQRVAALEDGGSSAVVTPLAPPAIVSRGPSVRHFFAAFARRNPGERAAAREDEPQAYAAQSIAGAASAEEGLTRADDAPRSLSDVFSAHGVAAGDAEAATTLASAFGAATESVVSSELSLQQLFRDVPARSAGAVTHAEYAEASASSEGPALDSDGEAPQADIEQFTAWLEGLKKK